MHPALSLITITALAGAAHAEGPDFAKDIAPLLETSWVKCHCEE